MTSGHHHHICHVCKREYQCAKVTHCFIEAKAVCYAKSCQDAFDKPEREEWDEDAKESNSR